MSDASTTSTPAASGPARRWPRLVWVLLPAIAFVGLLGAATLSKGSVPQPGDIAPAFAAPLLAGDRTLSVGDPWRKPLVLNFWASWCVTCKEEVPMLARAHKAYGDEVDFLGVDIRDARSDAIEFAREHGMTYPSVRDEDRSIATDYGLTGQPETFFIDQHGVIVQHVPGPLFEDDLLQMLDVLMRRNA